MTDGGASPGQVSEPVDVLMVTRLDRLARSTRDLLNVLARVMDAGASFKAPGRLG
jgi:DNA invertase Pin-like site-specific DNA recombinase